VTLTPPERRTEERGRGLGEWEVSWGAVDPVPMRS